jgi:hypothetical protein
MGKVYRAYDPELEREVAIKVLPSELAAESGGGGNHPDRAALQWLRLGGCGGGQRRHGLRRRLCNNQLLELPAQ